MPTPYEIGESYWDVSQTLGQDWPHLGSGGVSDPEPVNWENISGFWDDVFGEYVGPEQSGINVMTSYFVDPQFWGPQVELDPGEMYRAQESGVISSNLLRGQFGSTRIPELSKRIGGTGFATSGVQLSKPLYQQFEEGMTEIGQETEAAMGDVFESYGNLVGGVMGGLAGSGGLSDEFAGGEEQGGVFNMWSELEDDYNWSQYGFNEDFAIGLEECVESALSFGIDESDPNAAYPDKLPGWQDWAGITTGGYYQADNPNAIFDAVDYCKSIGGV